ncbi:unnamed protein product [Mucor circinelloides]
MKQNLERLQSKEDMKIYLLQNLHLPKKSAIVPSPSSSTTKADKDNAYKAAMEFMVEFKQKKMEQERRMDWIACLKEGTELNILNYKNTDSLRRPFYKYMNNKSQ